MMDRRMDYHLHTVHSFDGDQTLEELCTAADVMRMDEICLTEHIEPGHYEEGADVPPIWDVVAEEINAMRLAHPKLTIRMGCEIGDNPLMFDEINAYLDEIPLDYRLLSLHMVNGVDCYHADVYYAGKTRVQAYREYVEQKAASVLRWTNYDAVAHIGYAGRYAPYEDKIIRYEDAPDAFDTMLKRMIETGKALEINTSSIATTGEPMASRSVIGRYIDLGGELFTFGSDSHRKDTDFRALDQAKDMVRAMGGRYQCSYYQRRMTTYNI